MKCTWRLLVHSGGSGHHADNFHERPDDLIRKDGQGHTLADWLLAEAKEFSLEISPAGLKAWQDGFTRQRSQIPLVYVDEDDMRSSIEKYLKSGYGFTLW